MQFSQLVKRDLYKEGQPHQYIDFAAIPRHEQAYGDSGMETVVFNKEKSSKNQDWYERLKAVQQKNTGLNIFVHWPNWLKSHRNRFV